MADEQEHNKTLSFRTQAPLLHASQERGGESMQGWLGLGKSLGESSRSEQAVSLGVQQHPFDFAKATLMQTANVHHVACIKARTHAMVGNGFLAPGEQYGQPPRVDVESVADKTLNPLSELSFQDVLSDICEDYNGIGNGAMEVVRNGSRIIGLHHIPGHLVQLYIENTKYDRHYVIQSPEGDGQVRRFAVFGDKENFLRRWDQEGFPGDSADRPTDADSISEVIVFRQPSSLSRWYGFPSWLASVPSIELTQFFHQWKFDFFLNRGVPDFMLFVTGGKVDSAQWKRIEEAIKANIGLGNSHKSLAVNLDGQDIRVQVERLGMDAGGEDEFTKIKESLALDIVTAHQVPPLLAGIQIPGKLGAVNEFPNALLAFHTLVVAPAQRNIQQTLAATLGNPRINGGLRLSPTDFLLRRLIDAIDIGAADTISRMRTPAAAARAEGRDIQDGLKD